MEGDQGYHIAEVGIQDWVGHPPKLESYSRNLQDECYRKALDQPQVSALARFARFPSVLVRTSGGLCFVTLRDLRYARRSDSGWGVAKATVPLNSIAQQPAGSHP